MRVLVGLLLLVCLSGVASQPSQTVVQPDATNTFHFTNGNPATGWMVQGQNNPILNMTVGKTYYISIEFDTVGGNHPFGLNTNQNSQTVSEMGLVSINSTCGGSATGYTATATQKCVLSFAPATNTPQPLFYHCAVHSGMVGFISTGATPTTATPTTAAPSNGTTTPPKSDASGVVPGVAAIVLTAIAAVMAH